MASRALFSVAVGPIAIAVAPDRLSLPRIPARRNGASIFSETLSGRAADIVPSVGFICYLAARPCISGA